VSFDIVSFNIVSFDILSFDILFDQKQSAIGSGKTSISRVPISNTENEIFFAALNTIGIRSQALISSDTIAHCMTYCITLSELGQFFLLLLYVLH
jgi:hypothetical protein